jgi:methanogenic corrinoid protein MtbC1
MNGADPQTAARIDASRADLAHSLTERQFKRRAELEKRYGERGRAKCREDAEFHLRYLSQAIALGVPQVFSEYLAWASAMLESRGIPADDLRADMTELRGLLREELPHAAAVVESVVDAAIEAIGGAYAGDETTKLTEAAQRYLDAALHEGPLEASRVVDELVGAGLAPKRIYVEVLQPALHEAGRLWQTNRISVAEEHYCTAVTQRVLAKLYSDFLEGRARGPLVVVACVSGELHELGARMVCDLLSLEGYKTSYLGASMPAAAIVDYACMHDARVLALSASITPHLTEVRQAIAKARAEPRCKDLKVIVGGGAFNAVPTLWRAVGADAWAPDAAVAVEEIPRLLS